MKGDIEAAIKRKTRRIGLLQEGEAELI